jgi:transposase
VPSTCRVLVAASSPGAAPLYDPGMTAAPEGYIPGYRSKVAPSLYEEIFRRVYAGEKCKKIAPEYGVSGKTLQRIVRHMAKELGVPAHVWFEMKRRRRREGWEFIQEVRKYRDQQAMIERQEEEREAGILQARLEAASALERERERASRGARQRRLNAVNKRRNGWA